jgi:carbonic anhydrase/acetyltransferase-like protein (isoleucine patch superfamily)
MTIRTFENITPQLAAGVYVDETALVIGDVQIGPDSSIWPFTVVRGDVNQIRIGARSNIQDHTTIHVTHKSHYKPDGVACMVGDDVTVGHQAVLHACHIANNCLIGMGSIIMDNVQVGEYTIVGAGSLITENTMLEGGYLWIGRPARRLRALSEEERNYIVYSAQNYVRLKQRHQETSA